MKRVVLTLVLLLSSEAAANDTNYQNYITGGRAAGLGGAFTAIANDVSGLLYNPAGLVDDYHSDFSLSANLYGFERTERGGTPPSPIPSLSNIANVTTELVIIPSVAGAVRTFQKDSHAPGYLNALSFGMLVPSQRDATETLRRAGEAGSDDYKRQVHDRVFMPGFGYARKIGRRWRIGISNFAQLRSLQSNENIVSIKNGDPQAFRSADSSITITAASFLAILGVKFLASDAFHLGLSFAFPSIPVFSSTSFRYYRSGFDPAQTPQGDIKQVVTDSVKATYVQPAVLRVGGAYMWNERLTLTADVSVNFPVSYRLVSSDDPTIQGVLPLASAVQRLAVVNLNAGVEYLFSQTFALSGGFYTDFASSPELSGAQFSGVLNQQALSHIDLYGFTGALAFSAPNSVTRVGAMYSFGHGYDVVTREDFGRVLQDSSQFQRVENFKSFFYIFVSTTARFD